MRTMRIHKGFQLYLIIAIGVCGCQGTESRTTALHCYECPGPKNGTNPRGSCSDVILGTDMHCFPGEVCVKDTVFYKIWHPDVRYWFTVARVHRRCIRFEPGRDQGILGKCVWVPNVSPPFNGTRCLCNDTHYCNNGKVKGLNNMYDVLVLLLFSQLFLKTIILLVVLRY